MSSLKKKAIVVMLPTKKAQLGSILLVPDNKYREHLKGWLKTNKDNSGMQFTKITPQHLYICSTDEIKKENWVIYNDGGSKELRKVKEIKDGNALFDKNTFSKISLLVKVIATTDSSLECYKQYSNGISADIFKLPTVSNSFIQAYIKAYNEGNPITEVMVEYWVDDTNINTEMGTIEPKFRGNEVIITKVKDSWSREELEYMVNNYALDVLIAKNSGFSIPYYIDWINKHI